MTRGQQRTWTMMLLIATIASACGSANESSRLTELQRLQSGALDVILLSPREGLRHGKDTFVVEFRSASNGSLVDVGSVRGNASMPMSGMPMIGSLDVGRSTVAGRYAATGEFEMAGTWRMTIQWEGPVGQGSVTFASSVR